MNRIRAHYRTGAVLLIVLVAIVILSLSAYTFSMLMLVEEKATRLASRQVQARYLVESGVDYVRLFLSQDLDTRRELGGIWDNPTEFQSVLVSVNPFNTAQLGRFTVISSNMDDMGVARGFRYGLSDESARLNLNVLTFADSWQANGGRQLLMSLPLMTEDVADAILDWLDPDDEPREFGLESDWYASLSPPYAAKNGPLDSLEELLLVRGVTPQLLFGIDINHNGVVDPDEEAASGTSGLEPDMLLGWANYLTLFSKESNLNRERLQRININSEDLDQLYRDLRSAFNEQWSSFIIAYRQNGRYSGTEEPDPTAGLLAADPSQPAQYKFVQVLDLVDAVTTIRDAETGDTFVVESPIRSDNLAMSIPLIMEHLTTQQGESIPGRINIMQAPARVLASIPGMTEDVLDAILRVREFELDDPDGTDRNRQYETWLLVEGLVDLVTMRTMFPFICTGGDVYRAEIVGYFDDGLGASRAEVILDTTAPLPRILFWRDKTYLQNGYSIDMLGIGLQQ